MIFLIEIPPPVEEEVGLLLPLLFIIFRLLKVELDSLIIIPPPPYSFIPFCKVKLVIEDKLVSPLKNETTLPF